ncbi:MAG TPA: class I SAM-dependent methyltransferase [Anaerolineales bacterium]|nr:class I SAM-dependent methyltransferase [Anaerolineales bacterium]
MVSTDKKQIHLTKVQETMLITLYAKAIDNRSRKPILHDAKADELVGMIDYDFTKLNSWGNDNLIVVRAKQYDVWIQEFIKANPACVILNLGCGLDTRVTRINPPATVRWFDVDFPDVIQLRKNFYADRPGYQMIASSVTDPAWLVDIPTGRPVMIVAEGVLEYLTADEVKILLNRLTDRFSRGVVTFDVMNSFAIQSAKSAKDEPTAGLHKWEVNHIGEVDALDSKIKRDKAISLFQSPYVGKLPIGYHLLYSTMALVPKFRNMIRLLHYQF